MPLSWSGASCTLPRVSVRYSNSIAVVKPGTPAEHLKFTCLFTVEHTGEPTWTQRAWAAVLHCQRVDGVPDPESSALHGLSALAAFEGVAGRPAALRPCVGPEQDFDRHDPARALNASMKRRFRPLRLS